MLTPSTASNRTVSVLSNREVLPDLYHLAFEEPGIAARARPGQFLMVLIPGVRDPLLPRPFAIFNAAGKRVEILYKKVGKGTGLLAGLRPADRLHVLGPLGNGFSLPRAPFRTALVLAGGIGFASVHFLLCELVEVRTESIRLLYGARSREELFPVDAFAERGVQVHLATERGDAGLRGTVLDLLETVLDSREKPGTEGIEAYVCGPVAMLKGAAGLLARRGIQGQFSLEARMACGYGVCQGCTITAYTPGGGAAIRYRKVCTEGPVFPGGEVCWDDLQGPR